MQMLDTDQLKKLGKAKRGQSFISSIPNYSILQNPRYADLFFYEPIDRRNMELAPNDLISKILYFGEQQYRNKNDVNGDADQSSFDFGTNLK